MAMPVWIQWNQWRNFASMREQSALVFPGVASEFNFLSSDERMALMRVVLQVAKGRMPVVCSGGAGRGESYRSGHPQVAAIGS